MYFSLWLGHKRFPFNETGYQVFSNRLMTNEEGRAHVKISPMH